MLSTTTNKKARRTRKTGPASSKAKSLNTNEVAKLQLLEQSANSLEQQINKLCLQLREAELAASNRMPQAAAAKVVKEGDEMEEETDWVAPLRFLPPLEPPPTFQSLSADVNPSVNRQDFLDEINLDEFFTKHGLMQ